MDLFATFVSVTQRFLFIGDPPSSVVHEWLITMEQRSGDDAQQASAPVGTNSHTGTRTFYNTVKNSPLTDTYVHSILKGKCVLSLLGVTEEFPLNLVRNNEYKTHVSIPLWFKS